MSTLANWRIVLFWTKIGVACIGISAHSFFPSPLVNGDIVGGLVLMMMLIVALLSVVIGICLTAGFPDVLLMLVAAVLPPFTGFPFRCWGGVDELGAVEFDFFVLYIHCH
jgi:hypothetical protein